jgi:hypothetical protein
LNPSAGKNRVGIGLPYRPARLHGLAVKNTGSGLLRLRHWQSTALNTRLDRNNQQKLFLTCPSCREVQDGAGGAQADPVEGGQLGLEPGPAGQPSQAQSVSRRLQADLKPVLRTREECFRSVPSSLLEDLFGVWKGETTY